MKLIKDLGLETINNWLVHFGVFECPLCKNEFRANYSDISRGRKRHCGCAQYLSPLPAKINELNILKDLGTISGRRKAEFQCPYCPNTFTALVSDIKLKRCKSHCGCYVKPAKVIIPINKPIKTSIWDSPEYVSLGMSDQERISLLYAWQSMKRRCLSRTHPKFKDYGGRGISICDTWRNSFYHFVIDMGRKPSPSYTLDRKDNDGDYEPSNCRWATQSTQQNNKRNSKGARSAISSFVTH